MSKSVPCHGLLVLDKPDGMTSRDALNRCQFWFPRRTRLGHTGTLDPFATGVLVLCVGRATRLAEFVQDMGKTYLATFRLGAKSDTDDRQGNIIIDNNASLPTLAKIEGSLQTFHGEILQTPPAFSAVKLAGRRAHDLARQGLPTAIAPRPVRIDRITILKYEPPLLELEIDCGKGTYIRSLARDLGEALGCGGYVEQLRRTRVGPFHVDAGLSLDADIPTARAALLPLKAALTELPTLELDAVTRGKLAHGQKMPWEKDSKEGMHVVFDEAGDVFAIVRIENGGVEPVKVLQAAD